MNRKRPVKPEESVHTARLAAAAALDKKAENLSILNVTQVSGYADYFLIMSANSTRQVAAVADNVHLVLKKAGVKPLGVSGVREGQWALLDFGSVIVHVFYNPVRAYYDLESFWADAPRLEFEPEELAGLIPAPRRRQSTKNA